jgi:AcrR family transcriptional regulator
MARKNSATDAKAGSRAAAKERAARTRQRVPDGQRKLTQRDEATRQRIISAAAEIYRECGYERAGMTDIARRLGMTAPALYWYFRSKESILLAFLEHTIDDLIRYVGSRVHATDPKQRLWEFMYAYVLWQLQQQELSAAYERIFALGHLRNSLPEKQRQRVTSREREFYGMCRELIAAVQGRRKASGAVAPVAFAMIGMVEHLISWYRLSGAMSVKQVAKLYADLAVAMAVAAPNAAANPRKISLSGIDAC